MRLVKPYLLQTKEEKQHRMYDLKFSLSATIGSSQYEKLE
jgi:hypothetical protein